MAMRGFQTEWYWVWAGIGYVLGMALLQLAAQVVALTYLGREWLGRAVGGRAG